MNIIFKILRLFIFQMQEPSLKHELPTTACLLSVDLEFWASRPLQLEYG